MKLPPSPCGVRRSIAKGPVDLLPAERVHAVFVHPGREHRLGGGGAANMSVIPVKLKQTFLKLSEHPLLQHPAQIAAITVLVEARGQRFELRGGDVAHAIGDFLGAGDLEPLPLLDGFDKE